MYVLIAALAACNFNKLLQDREKTLFSKNKKMKFFYTRTHRHIIYALPVPRSSRQAHF